MLIFFQVRTFYIRVRIFLYISGFFEMNDS